MKNNQIKFGYWKESQNTNLPNPQDLIVDKIDPDLKKKIIHFCNTICKPKTRYRGFANCRICNERLGSADFTDPKNKVLFPEKFEHYVEKHNVLPNEEVIKYILCIKY